MQTDVAPTEEAGLAMGPIIVILLLAVAVLGFVYAYKSGKFGSKK